MIKRVLLGKKNQIESHLHSQSADIAWVWIPQEIKMKEQETMTMFGYACDETDVFMLPNLLFLRFKING